MSKSCMRLRATTSRFSLPAFLSLVLMLLLAGCGSGGGSSPPVPSTTATISGTVTAESALAASVICVNELRGADVYLYDADRLDWVYPVARATTGADCSYTLKQLVNSDFNRKADGSKAYNDNNPIPAGNYTVIASNNIMVTGGNQLVAVQAQISHFKGEVVGNDLVASSNNMVPAVQRMLGLGRNPDGGFCGTDTGTGSNEAIQITFNMAMARLSVINNIRITDGLGSRITGRWTVSADLLSATFYPYPGLTQGMGYTIDVDAKIQNVYGRRLAESANCSFVAGGVSPASPQAVWYAPASTTNVPVNTPIQIASSKYLDMGTMHVSSMPSIGAKPAVRYVGDTSTEPGKPYIYEIVPAGLLAYGASYSIGISDALDLAGNALAPLSTSFTTMATPVAPVVTSTSPADSATGVALNTDVRAVFSSQMYPSTISAANFTLIGGSAKVAGSVSYDAASKSAVFTPDTSLLENTLYTARISTGVADVSGLAMAADRTWSFTTIQTMADATAPSVPTELQASAAGTSQINLSWRDASDNIAVTGYKIYSDAGSLVASTAGTGYSHTGLGPGTEYCYRVSAFDTAGNESGKSAPACAATSQPALPTSGRWTATATVSAPSGRSYHTAVWTGSKMIVWGGINIAGTGINDFTVNTGGIYDPAASTWASTTTTGAPSKRYGHAAVWTGSRMIVWGGTPYGGSSSYNLDTGGSYDPASDTWVATTTTGAPSARSFFASVWTGSKMIVWGGSDINGNYLNSGGIFDPSSGTWSVINNAGAPTGRIWPAVVWTGSKMIVWGGYRYANGPAYLDGGGIYDPATDTWTAMTTTGAPTGRNTHTAVWTGSKMIVFGGYDGNRYLTSGGIYDPASDTWVAVANSGAPAVAQHTAIWTGARMIVWNDGLSAGGIYDPATDAWSTTATAGAPEARYMHSAVWTGGQMIVWGGYAGSTLYDTGGIYTP